MQVHTADVPASPMVSASVESATPPLCARCGVTPVKRCKPSDHVAGGRAPRVIDGKHWRWFCGGSCASPTKRRTPRRPQPCAICPAMLREDQQRRGQKTCSRSCATRLAAQQPSDARRAAAHRATAKRRAGYFKRVLREVLEACRPHTDDDGRVPLREVARIVLKFRRQGYNRGWAARDARAVRGVDGRRRP